MASPSKVWVGTSGYQYPEWRGTFYPEKLSTAKMLAYYAERFSTTEVNYSFRQVPSESTLVKWRDGTPEMFRFTLKAPQKITHFAKLRGCENDVAFFAERSRTLGAKLGITLFQLPPSLESDLSLLRDFLAIIPPTLRSAFEFRHSSWFTDNTYSALRQANAALCIADTDELATPAIRTANFAYFRLRRLDYQPKDLDRWANEARAMEGKANETFVYFKHEEAGLGPKFATAFAERLGIQPPGSAQMELLGDE